MDACIRALEVEWGVKRTMDRDAVRIFTMFLSLVLIILQSGLLPAFADKETEESACSSFAAEYGLTKGNLEDHLLPIGTGQTFKLTGYYLSPALVAKWGGSTAMGPPAVTGVCACSQANPPFPMGSVLFIPSLGRLFIACDTGGSREDSILGSYWLDIFCNTEAECYQVTADGVPVYQVDPAWLAENGFGDFSSQYNMVTGANVSGYSFSGSFSSMTLGSYEWSDDQLDLIKTEQETNKEIDWKKEFDLEVSENDSSPEVLPAGEYGLDPSTALGLNLTQNAMSNASYSQNYPAWSSTGKYNDGDCVVYQGNVWKCLDSDAVADEERYKGMSPPDAIKKAGEGNPPWEQLTGGSAVSGKSEYVQMPTCYDTDTNAKMYSFLVDIVNKYALGTGCPYVWGGTSPGNWDCSGFTMWVYREYFGISLPHYSGAQANCGRAVAPNDIQPGDLLYFGHGHVAIYIGNGQMVHARNENLGTDVSDYGWNADAIRRLL